MMIPIKPIPTCPNHSIKRIRVKWGEPIKYLNCSKKMFFLAALVVLTEQKPKGVSSELLLCLLKC